MKGNTGEVDLEERGVGERLGGVEGEEAAVWVHYIREEKKYFFKKSHIVTLQFSMSPAGADN